jgi:predicted O-methyltransferase YrrM
LFIIATMFSIRFVKDWLLHRLRSKNRHGLHSPFVYKLVDTVIYDFHAKNVYTEVENLREGLLNDTRSITLTDALTGVLRQKKISLVGKETLKTPKADQLLYRLAAYLKPGNMIELGACPGITALYLHQAIPKISLYAWEEYSETYDIAQDTFKKAQVDSINLITGNYDKTIPRLIDALDKVDFILANTGQKEEALKYFELCLPKIHEQTVFIFTGIYQNEGMKEAWQEIKAHPKVTVTVDLFWLGLVFFREGQEREEFKIKF